jgi:hypothetical protein
MKLRRLLLFGIASAAILVGTPAVTAGPASAVETDCAAYAGNYNNWHEEAQYYLDAYYYDYDNGFAIESQSDLNNYYYAQSRADHYQYLIETTHCP